MTESATTAGTGAPAMAGTRSLPPSTSPIGDHAVPIAVISPMIPRIWRHGIWLLLILALHVMSLSVFSTGFLLMRRELSLFSSMQPPAAFHSDHRGAPSTFHWDGHHGESVVEADADLVDSDADSGEPLSPTFSPPPPPVATNEGWRPRRWKKAVFIVIDALRYDFTLHDATKDPDTTPYYLNKLPVFDEMLRTRPDHSLRIQVRADPPTTTMQRIKGVTTGGLPTFIDAGSNFGGALITEDNIVWQAINAGRNVTFMGDDTWESLFPNTFNTSYPYPSLVVYDLHTVDNGVASHLYPALTEDTSSSWDVLIAHFLGVDHAGHRYGPEHPEMALKLTQMNDWIKRVFQEMDDDTIVFLMGDHGMDAKGDHGGDSENELNAGFFAYSKSRPLSDLPQDQRESLMTQIRERLKAIPLGSDAPLVELKGERTLPQIDFVPSFCLLTGLPVPFGNLGSLIPELFLHGATPHDALNELLHAAQLNARQIYHYIESYSAPTSRPFGGQHAATGDHRADHGHHGTAKQGGQRGRDRSRSGIGDDHVRILFREAEERYAALSADSATRGRWGWPRTGLAGSASSEHAVDEDLLDAYIAYAHFTRAALIAARRMWARFDVPCIILGALGMLATTLLAAALCYRVGVVGPADTASETEMGPCATLHPREWRSLIRGGLLGGVVGWFQPVLFVLSLVDLDLSAETSLAMRHEVLTGIVLGMTIGGIRIALGCFLLRRVAWARAWTLDDVDTSSSMQGSSPRGSITGSKKQGEDSAPLLSSTPSTSPSFLESARSWYAHPASSPLSLVLGTTLLVMHGVSVASDSFTIYEEPATAFLLGTYALVQMGSALSPARARNRLARVQLLLMSFAFLVLNRVSQSITVCREEMHPFCTPTFFTGPWVPEADPTQSATEAVAPLSGAAAIPARFLIPCLAIAYLAFLGGLAATLHASDNLRGAARVQCFFALPLALVLSWLYWSLDTWESHRAFDLSAGQDATAWAADAAHARWIGLKRLTAAWGFPVAVLLPLVLWGSNSATTAFEIRASPTLSPSLSSATGKPAGQLVFHGIPNAIGAAMLLLMAVIVAIWTLVLPPMGTIMAVCGFLQMICLLEIHAAWRDLAPITHDARDAGTDPVSEPRGAPSGHRMFLHLVVLTLLAHRYFFATGHQATLSSIQWNAAFIGAEASGDVNMWLAPLLVGLNTFGAYVAFGGLGAVLLAVWKRPLVVAPAPIPPPLGATHVTDVGADPLAMKALYVARDDADEAVTRRAERRMHGEALTALLGWAALIALHATAVVAFSGHFRRHLMVWRVWAPRFVFAALALVVAEGIAAAVALAALARTAVAYRSFLQLFANAGVILPYRPRRAAERPPLPSSSPSSSSSSSSSLSSSSLSSLSSERKQI